MRERFTTNRRECNEEGSVKIDFGRAAAAGIAGTLVMTAVGLWAGPIMGIPRMNPAEMLAGVMGGSSVAGWVAHFMIGVVLAVVYAWTAPVIPGPAARRGGLYAIAPFLLAQIVVMPAMGMPVFSGSARMAMGSLIGHLIYGSVIGAVYGLPAAATGDRTRAHRSVAAH
jgi:hypothetical protein